MRILLTESTDEGALKVLATAGEVVQMEKFDESELSSQLREADAVIIRAKARLGGDILRACPRLKCIAKAGVGLDNIDVDTARELGVKVISAAGLNANAVAEHAIAMGLALCRKIVSNDRAVRDGRWWDLREPQLVEAAGSTLGIVGLGSIGRRVAAIGRALNMSVIACDIVAIADGNEKDATGVQRASFEDVLRNADLLSLHVPLTESTYHLIGERELQAMKSTAILVNTSRGAVVDQMALVRALSSGRLLGAALDVLEMEPPALDDPLLGLDNVILSPHAAALTRQSFRSVALFIANEVVKALSENSALKVE